MECLEYENGCGMYNVRKRICCLYCEHKNYCKGFCGYLERNGINEEVAKNCSDFVQK